MSLSASLLLGVLLGVAYSAAALLVARRAAGFDDSGRALRLIMAGMLVRMVFMLSAVAVILATVPVERLPFIAGLGVTFTLGLLAEVTLIGRTTAAPSDS